MSLMKRALDAARLRLGRIGRKMSGATIATTAISLPSARGGGRQVFDPIWVGRTRMSYSDSSGSTKAEPTAKQRRRARDNEMRAGLPTMSGRQWRRIRKAMYRKAKFLTIQQRQEAGR